MKRRAFFIATTLTAAAAGCLGSGDSDDENSSGNNTSGNGNATGTENETATGNGEEPEPEPDPAEAAFSVRPQGSYQEIVTDLPVTFDASESTGDVESYEWNLPEGTASGETTTVTFPEAREYEIGLTVTGVDGETDEAKQTVTVLEDLSANFSITPPDPVPGQEVTLDASGSTGEIESYEWQINGREESGVTTSITADTAQEYTISLTITDVNGRSATDGEELSVDRTLTVQGDEPLLSGQEVTFSVDGAVPDGTEYQWDFQDDGTTDTTTDDASVTHVFEEAGTRTVAVRLRRDGAVFDTKSRELTVTEPVEAAIDALTEVAEVVNESELVDDSGLTTARNRLDEARSVIDTVENRSGTAGGTTVEPDTLRGIAEFQERLLRDLDLTVSVIRAIEESRDGSVTSNVVDGNPQGISDTVESLELDDTLQEIRSNRTGMESLRRDVAGEVDEDPLSYTEQLDEYVVYGQTEIDGLGQLTEMFRELLTVLRQLAAGRAAFTDEDWQEAADSFSAAERTAESYATLRQQYDGPSAGELLGFRLPPNAPTETLTLHSEAATAATEGDIETARSRFSEATTAIENTSA